MNINASSYQNMSYLTGLWKPVNKYAMRCYLHFTHTSLWQYSCVLVAKPLKQSIRKFIHIWNVLPGTDGEMESEGKFSVITKYLKEEKVTWNVKLFFPKIFGPVQNVVCIVTNNFKVQKPVVSPNFISDAFSLFLVHTKSHYEFSKGWNLKFCLSVIFHSLNKS